MKEKEKIAKEVKSGESNPVALVLIIESSGPLVEVVSQDRWYLRVHVSFVQVERRNRKAASQQNDEDSCGSCYI